MFIKGRKLQKHNGLGRSTASYYTLQLLKCALWFIKGDYCLIFLSNGHGEGLKQN